MRLEAISISSTIAVAPEATVNSTDLPKLDRKLSSVQFPHLLAAF
jgi:hypothetical protein